MAPCVTGQPSPLDMGTGMSKAPAWAHCGVVWAAFLSDSVWADAVPGAKTHLGVGVQQLSATAHVSCRRVREQCPLPWQRNQCPLARRREPCAAAAVQVKLPLLAPGAVPLDMRRLFTEVCTCKSIGGVVEFFGAERGAACGQRWGRSTMKGIDEGSFVD
eukprot:358760-Chlamydomonas_euryale.AAC.3